MRIIFLLADLLLILLFALLSYWVSQHFLQPTPPLLPPISTPSFPQDTVLEKPPLTLPIEPSLPPKLRPKPPSHIAKLVDSIYAQTKTTHSYDPAYVKLPYPNGDVDSRTGVCTDVVIRAFRAQGIDLQKQVHEDMQKSFKAYPKQWGMRTTDSNIDHRRVPNLMTFFERQGKSLKVTLEASDYKTGDVVVWELPSGQEHIGVVMAERSADELRPLIGHNVGEGTKVQDILLAWPIKGHYRYFEPKLVKTEQP